MLSHFKHNANTGHREKMFPIDFGANMVKVKVTLTFNIDCHSLALGSFPFTSVVASESSLLLHDIFVT